jgi:hypothetical protein
MSEAPVNALDLFRQEARLSPGELWWRYFELAGMSDPSSWTPSCTARSSPRPTTATSSLTR